MTPRTALLAFAPLLVPSAASAQFNDKWASFRIAPTAVSAPQPVSDDDHETDLDWADLDLDGDVDLVVARKEPFTTAGKRSNVLLVNEAGVLTDRTAALAAGADVPGDQGFLTPTNDRDVVIADLDGDGFPEVVTATEQTVGEPKHVSHPRVYRNLGNGGATTWLGLRYEEGRIPQLLHLTSGVPLEPRFAAVDAGDLDGDGSVDLYFGDHDTGTTLFGGLQPPSEDTDDRLLRNDGTGFFTDVSATAMTSAMLFSGFCNSVEIADFNGDGLNDVLKQTSYEPGQAMIDVAYGDPGAPGTFAQQDSIAPGSPYFVSHGDLNNDGRPDLVVTQNMDDGAIYNLGNGAGGTAQWSPLAPFEFLSGGAPVSPSLGISYSSNNLVADLDGDGWPEVLVADVDVEVPSYEHGFRLHLYHNRGDAGDGTVTLVEERASTLDSTWVGAHGLRPRDLRWTHDVAAFDVDLDGRTDLVLSRREGTQVWLQNDPPACQPDLGFGPGQPVLEVCGGDLSAGNDADLLLFAGAPSAPTFLAVAPSASPTFVPELGITVVPFPPTQIDVLATDASGELSLLVPGGLGPATIVVQAAQLSTGATPLVASNAVEMTLLP